MAATRPVDRASIAGIWRLLTGVRVFPLESSRRFAYDMRPFGGIAVKPKIHPDYRPVQVTCSCGNAFTVHSTYSEDALTVEVCSECHPFYTGKHKIMESAGQVDKFRKRYGRKSAAAKTT